MFNYHIKTMTYETLIETYDLINQLEFEKNFTPNINFLEKCLLGLHDGSAYEKLYINIDYSNDRLKFLDQNSYNLFKTYLEFIELNAFPLKNLKVLKPLENLKYNDLSGREKRRLSSANFLCILIDDETIEEYEEALKNLL